MPKGQRKQPPITIRVMDDDEFHAQKEPSQRPTPPPKIGEFEKNKRNVESGETFRSQKPSDFRRKIKRK